MAGEPRTEAGKRLLEAILDSQDGYIQVNPGDAILAIEAEAATDTGLHQSEFGMVDENDSIPVLAATPSTPGLREAARKVVWMHDNMRHRAAPAEFSDDINALRAALAATPRDEEGV